MSRVLNDDYRRLGCSLDDLDELVDVRRSGVIWTGGIAGTGNRVADHRLDIRKVAFYLVVGVARGLVAQFEVFDGVADRCSVEGPQAIQDYGRQARCRHSISGGGCFGLLEGLYTTDSIPNSNRSGVTFCVSVLGVGKGGAAAIRTVYEERRDGRVEFGKPVDNDAVTAVAPLDGDPLGPARDRPCFRAGRLRGSRREDSLASAAVMVRPLRLRQNISYRLAVSGICSRVKT